MFMSKLHTDITLQNKVVFAEHTFKSRWHTTAMSLDILSSIISICQNILVKHSRMICRMNPCRIPNKHCIFEEMDVNYKFATNMSVKDGGYGARQYLVKARQRFGVSGD